MVVVIGQEESSAVEAEDNLLPMLETRIDGKHLRLGIREGQSIRPNRPIIYRIGARQIDALGISGFGSITATGISNRLLGMHISGSGNIEIAGKSETLKAEVSGSGWIDAGNLAAQSVTASLTGSGNISVDAARELKVHVTGSGSVKYRGSPAVTS